MDKNDTMLLINFAGLYAGLFMLFAIGFGFFWVIKLEYYVGACSKRIVLLLGLIMMFSTVYISNFTAAVMIGIIAGSTIWGSTEMSDQEERSSKGQFPNNPNKLCNRLKSNFLISHKQKNKTNG